MALLRYLKPLNGLPDPRGSLSSSIPSTAIEEANTQVQKVTGGAKNRKRGPYKKYSPSLRLEIGPVSMESRQLLDIFRES